MVLALSTTKRTWEPELMVSISSFAVTTKVTLRPSGADAKRSAPGQRPDRLFRQAGDVRLGPKRRCRPIRTADSAASVADDPNPRFAERELRNKRGGSFRLDMGRPDHLGPLPGFFDDQLAEVGMRARKYRATVGVFLGRPSPNQVLVS